MSEDKRRPEINMSAIPVAGIGGLGLLAMAVVVAWVLPAGRLLLAASAIGGAAIGLAIVFIRRFRPDAGPSGDHPQVLFQAEAQGDRKVSRDRATAPHDLERLLAVR
jgi:hypothetical protein